MKLLAATVLYSVAALGQAPVKVITFSRADTEHCKVTVVSGKPLLESTYDGTSVAIGMPVKRANGEFAIFVVVARLEPATIQVNPKDFYGLYSDPTHTRFTFYDATAEMGPARPPIPGMSTATNQLGSGSGPPGPGAPPPGSGGPAPGSSGDSGPPGGPPSVAPGLGTPSMYFHRGKIKQGARIGGWIILRPVKGSKLEVHSTDMLDEIDLPVNGIVFRF